MLLRCRVHGRRVSRTISPVGRSGRGLVQCYDLNLIGMHRLLSCCIIIELIANVCGHLHSLAAHHISHILVG